MVLVYTDWDLASPNPATTELVAVASLIKQDIAWLEEQPRDSLLWNSDLHDFGQV
jgi:hypothetical protein